MYKTYSCYWMSTRGHSPLVHCHSIMDYISQISLPRLISPDCYQLCIIYLVNSWLWLIQSFDAKSCMCLYCIAFVSWFPVSWFWSSARCPGFLRFPVPCHCLDCFDYPLINVCVWILNSVFRSWQRLKDIATHGSRREHFVPSKRYLYHWGIHSSILCSSQLFKLEECRFERLL